ncbi:MAG: benzoyl-CoA reductase subunit C [Myxococcota bacterium]
MRVHEIVAKVDAIHHDLSYGTVRAWQAANGGAKAVGYLPIYVPRELIHAAGMMPVGLLGGAGQLEIIRGDAYFQSYICQMPRSTIELALAGRLDFLSGFLFPSICDVIRNLSGIWKILFPEKYVRYFDVPQNYDPEVGGKYYLEELEILRHDLGKLSGIEITDERLRASIAVYNENRKAICALLALRQEEPWSAPADESYLVLRAGSVLPVEEHTALVLEYVEAAKEAKRPRRDQTRVVAVGAFCEQPPLALIKTLELAGCYVIWDDTQLGQYWFDRDVETSGDPMAALSTAFLKYSAATASRYEPEIEKGTQLCQLVRHKRAEGVIFAAPSFCDPALLDQPMLQKAMDAAKVPWTAFKYAENLGQFQVIREQAGTFADSVKLWSEP